MISLFLIPLFAGSAAALLFLYRRSRQVLRRLACEGGAVALMLGVFAFLVPHPDYPVGPDVLHSLGNGRFQIWQSEDVVYSVLDAAKDADVDRCVSNVVKWSEGERACYFVTLDRKCIVVGKADGTREVFADYDSIPQHYVEPFRKMRFWGPYGQLMEDVSHAHWTRLLMLGILVTFIFRIFYLLGMARAKES